MKANLDYVNAMQSFNDFFEMLLSVVEKSAIPEISTSSAFGWRGYQIDRYRNLAASQYYCEIYYEDAHILRFQETYKDGKYRYPFTVTKDLKETAFFSLSQEGQTAFLAHFVRDALAEAVVWQDTDDRRSKVPAEFRMGKRRSNPRGTAKGFGQISDKYLLASPMQADLFAMLKRSIDRMSKLVLSRTNTTRTNAQWRNWAYRGYRTKINEPNGTEPSGSFDYVWRIYFDEPVFIRFEANDGTEARRLNSFPLNNDFLSSTEIEQQTLIDGFVRKSLKSTDCEV